MSQPAPHAASEQPCPNCGAPLQEKYCGQCGQPTHLHRPTLLYFLGHFLSDIFHYDGRLARTLRLLLAKPGFLSQAYKEGVREKYVDPFRLYLFLSALIFIIFLMLERKEESYTRISHPDVIQSIDSARTAAIHDTAIANLLQHHLYVYRTGTAYGHVYKLLLVKEPLRHGMRYYDSVQQTLPPTNRSRGFQRYQERKLAAVYEGYDTAPYNFNQQLREAGNLEQPKSFFISIPLFILSLMLFYFPKKKNFVFGYHTVFAMHFYCVVWIIILLDSSVCYILEHLGAASVEYWIAGPLYLSLIPYLYIAMRRFYREHWLLTILKMLLVLSLFVYCYIKIVEVISIYSLLSLS